MTSLKDDDSTIEILTPDPGFVHKDSQTQEGFTQIQNRILRDARLTMQARLTYIVMKSYAWDKELMFAGQEAMARHLGVTTRQLRDYIKELQLAGLVEVKHRPMRTNVYLLTDRVSPLWLPDAAKPSGN